MTTLHSQTEVKFILESSGLHPLAIDIGEIEIKEILPLPAYRSLECVLLDRGFGLVADRENILTEKVKNVVIEMIHFSEELPLTKYSNYISNKLKTNYTYLSKVFSRVKNTTIEHFIIVHKIERVKQLISYNELSLSEIAFKLHYSSTAHLSAQFKKVTGLTPSLFRKSKYKDLTPVESL